MWFLCHFVHYTVTSCVFACSERLSNMKRHGERRMWNVTSVDGHATAVKLEPES